MPGRPTLDGSPGQRRRGISQPPPPLMQPERENVMPGIRPGLEVGSHQAFGIRRYHGGNISKKAVCVEKLINVLHNGCKQRGPSFKKRQIRN
jgi:hypothetical protein